MIIPSKEKAEPVVVQSYMAKYGPKSGEIWLKGFSTEIVCLEHAKNIYQLTRTWKVGESAEN